MSDTYTALKRARAFRMKVHAPQYAAREGVGVGGELFDVMLAYREDDGSVVFTDIGGQGAPGFDPEKGHGALLRYRRDGSVAAIVPPTNMQQFVPMNIHRAPEHYGRWGGHLFLPCQTFPGRPGANRPHGVLRVAPGADTPDLFVVLPNAGTIGGGIPGAAMTAGFAPKGSPFGEALICWTMKNCTVYIVRPNGEAEVFLNFDRAEGQMMPAWLTFAPSWWGDLAGELIMTANVGFAFNAGKPSPDSIRHFRVTADGALHPLDKLPAPLHAVRAPPEFGPFAGQLFFTDEGEINLATEEGCDEYPGEYLPYNGRILRQDADGQVHVFADDYWGSYTTLVFDGPRLMVGLCGKSYSTGEYHVPDGAIYEIAFKG